MLQRPILIYDTNTNDSLQLKGCIDEIQPNVSVITSDKKAEVLELAQSSGINRPGLIFMDIEGEENNIELIQSLKSSDATIILPIVVITKLNDNEYIDVCFKNGVAGYMLKPSDGTSLRDLAEKMLNYWNKSQFPIA